MSVFFNLLHHFSFFFAVIFFVLVEIIVVVLAVGSAQEDVHVCKLMLGWVSLGSHMCTQI